MGENCVGRVEIEYLDGERACFIYNYSPACGRVCEGRIGFIAFPTNAPLDDKTRIKILERCLEASMRGAYIDEKVFHALGLEKRMG